MSARRRPRVLSAEDAAVIRERYALATAIRDHLPTVYSIAAEYGVTQTTIHALVTGRTYTDAPGPLHRPRPSDRELWRR